MTTTLTAAACGVLTRKGPCVMSAGHADPFHRGTPRGPLQSLRAMQLRDRAQPARPAELTDPGLPCRHPDIDPELFFPIGNAAPDPLALAACTACPARTACLEAAVAYGPDTAGVWGGTTALQRRILQQQQVA